MIHLIQRGPGMQAQFRILTEEHRVDRCTVDFASGPCGAASREPSGGSRIEPVQRSGASVGSALSHLICMHSLVPEGVVDQVREGEAEERGNMNSASRASVTARPIVAPMLLTPAGCETCTTPARLIKRKPGDSCEAFVQVSKQFTFCVRNERDIKTKEKVQIFYEAAV